LIGLPIIKDGLVSFRHEVAKVTFKGGIPGDLIAKAALDLGDPHVEVSPVKQVVGALDDAGLKEGKTGDGLLVRVIQQQGNIVRDPIQPGIFLRCEVDVLEGFLDEVGIGDAWLCRHQLIDGFIGEGFRPVLDECQADRVVEG
jgi:hypothetical protein